MWRMHFRTANGLQMTIRGRKRSSLLRTVDKLACKGMTPTAYRVYCKSQTGVWYRFRLRACIENDAQLFEDRVKANAEKNTPKGTTLRFEDYV